MLIGHSTATPEACDRVRVAVRPGLTALALSLSIAGCGGERLTFVEGDAADTAKTWLLALEQDEQISVEVSAAREGAWSIQVPDAFSEDTPATLSLVGLSQPLGFIRPSGPGPLLPATGRTRTLASLGPIYEEVATLFDATSPPVLVRGELRPRLADFPIARIPDCPQITFEFLVNSNGALDAVSVRPDLAVGLAFTSLTTLRPDGRFEETLLSTNELGEGIGLSRQGAVWVTTSSRAMVFDPDSGELSRSIPLPADRSFRGVFDDESSGRLYAISTEIDVWAFEHTERTWTLVYSPPAGAVRQPEAADSQVRILPLRGPDHFLVLVDELNALLEYGRGVQNLVVGARTGRGFSAGAILETGEVLVTESFTGDLYLFDGVSLVGAGQGPAQVYGLSPLGPRRWMFVTEHAVMGVLDLDDPRSCPDTALVNWDKGSTIVRVGDDFWVGASTNRAERGWGRVTAQFALP